MYIPYFQYLYLSLTVYSVCCWIFLYLMSTLSSPSYFLVSVWEMACRTVFCKYVLYLSILKSDWEWLRILHVKCNHWNSKLRIHAWDSEENCCYNCKYCYHVHICYWLLLYISLLNYLLKNHSVYPIFFTVLAHLGRRLTRWAYSIPIVRRPSIVVVHSFKLEYLWS